MTEIKEDLDKMWDKTKKKTEELKDQAENKIDELKDNAHQHKVERLEDKIEVLEEKTK